MFAKLKRLEPVAVKGLTAGLFILWILYPSFTAYIKDEALLQIEVDRHLVAGTFPVHGISGSASIAYGPAAVWFYLLVRMVSAKIWFPVLAHVCFCIFGFFIFSRAIKRLTDSKTAQMVLLLIASSPFLAFYSRQPWDNTLLMPFSALLFYGLVRIKEKFEIRFCGLIGFSAALMWNTHLMSIPVLFCGAISVLYLFAKELLKNKKRASFGLLVTVLVFAIVAFPYIRYLMLNIGIIGTPPPANYSFWSHLIEMTLSVNQPISYTPAYIFFDGPVQLLEFIGARGWIGQSLKWVLSLDLLGLPTKFFLLLIPAISLFVNGIRKQFDFFDAFVLLVILCHVGWFQYLKLPAGSQYHQAVWWVAFWAVGKASILLKNHWIWKIYLSGLLLLNLVFLTVATYFIYRNHGARGQYFGAVLGDQMSLVTRLCEYSKNKDLDELMVNIAPIVIDAGSLERVYSLDESCKGTTIRFFKGRTTPPNVELQYKREGGYSASIEFIEAGKPDIRY